MILKPIEHQEKKQFSNIYHCLPESESPDVWSTNVYFLNIPQAFFICPVMFSSFSSTKALKQFFPLCSLTLMS